jgi:hypothetical protein
LSACRQKHQAPRRLRNHSSGPALGACSQSTVARGMSLPWIAAPHRASTFELFPESRSPAAVFKHRDGKRPPLDGQCLLRPALNTLCHAPDGIIDDAQGRSGHRNGIWVSTESGHVPMANHTILICSAGDSPSFTPLRRVSRPDDDTCWRVAMTHQFRRTAAKLEITPGTSHSAIDPRQTIDDRRRTPDR